MSLKELRQNRHMTQKELAYQSGVNFRSLQDYEQGHKQLSVASGDILLRLSTVLGCSSAELLLPDHIEGADLHPHNQLTPSVIQAQHIYCEKYDTAGRWICKDGKLSTFFFYEGLPYCLPFAAHFTEKMLPCLREAAALQMETKIDNLISEKDGFESW